jgi:Tfp pilus assembly protein PilF
MHTEVQSKKQTMSGRVPFAIKGYFVAIGRRKHRQLTWRVEAILPFAILVCLGVFTCPGFGQTTGTLPPQESNAVIEFVQNDVEVLRSGSTIWDKASSDPKHHLLTPGDQIRTGENSRAGLYSPEHQATIILDANSLFVVPKEQRARSYFELLFGRLFNFHRGTDDEERFTTPTVSAIVRGTDFSLKVEPGGKTTVSMIDGHVHLENSVGQIDLSSGEEAVVQTGMPPRRAAGITTVDIVQWCYYYPAVLDLEDLPLTAEEQQSLEPSLDAYRAGDLLAALASYPKLGRPVSDAHRIYHAALLLSVGQVEQTETELATLPAPNQTNRLARLATSLRTLIAAVKRQPEPGPLQPQLPTELLAASYCEQSQAKGDASLNAALEMARRAAAQSPQFSFAWERIAELEFSLGQTRGAVMALDKSLEVSPRNAQALALKGYLLAAQNNITDATTWFDRAITTDGALGNAWLGRGLCSIRRGNLAQGLRDLLVAAATEPQRSLLRSYLAKGFSDAGKNAMADREIALAIGLDTNDPTAWLYSALIKQQENQVNQAIGDMEKSQSLNNNRQLFRSKMLLDQDNAVRSVNLATMYDDAGMNEYNDAGMADVGAREAAKAVTYDYDNASAHLFLSDSYNELRDPTRFNLRYETAWYNELLLANMLAPVGAGRLSQTLSQQEYSQLFQEDGVGIANQSSYRSDGQFTTLAGQYGTYKNTSWASDLDYQHNNGMRPNNQLDDIEWDTTLKQQLTPSDTAMAIVQYYNYHSGDNFQYYNPSASYRPHFEFEENQNPTLVGGFQHIWSPDTRTLLLVGRLVDKQNFSDLQVTQTALLENPSGNITPPSISDPYNVRLEDSLEIYSTELCQIIQKDRFTFISGGRWQGGHFDFSDLLNDPLYLSPPFPSSVSGSFKEPFERLGGYGYLTVEPVDKLWLTGGFAYDSMQYPSNYRSLPQSPGTQERDRPEPKAAFVWSPLDQVTVRGIYSRSMGGVSLDESYRLEPTELAGFVQTYRSVIPESIVGSVSAENVEVEGLALDVKLGHGTFAGLEAQHLDSCVQQTIGDFLFPDASSHPIPATTQENFNYDEKSLAASINQLLPDGFVAGLNYSFTRSELKATTPQVPVSVSPSLDQTAYLNQIGTYLRFNHPSGFFAQFDAHGYLQENYGYDGTEPGDDFVQLNLEAGWRLFNRHAQILVGLMNLTGQDYQLNPLNVYSELPRKRVFFSQLSFQF